MNRLKNTRGYLCGAMDFSDDFGVGWRILLKQALKELGVIWLDPTDKPLHDASRGKEEVKEMRRLMHQKQYNSIEYAMQDIRFVDLRMVDVSDFIVMYLDMDIHHCGTYVEFTRANGQDKPIITIIKQGKKSAPTWLLGEMPHNFIFNNLEEAIDYLHHVSSSQVFNPFHRWLFFNFHGESNGKAVQ